MDEHYLTTFRPTAKDQAIYDVSMALLDYYLEHGSKQSSAEAIKARLKHMQRFIDREVKAGRLSDPVLPDMIDNNFLNRFREWLLAEPIVARKKNEQGEWVAGKSRPRSPATVEESIIQLKAALNHAWQNRRILYVPPIKHKTRPEVSAARTDRITVAQMAEMLDYTCRGAGNYAGHAARLLPLRRYLIAAICTLARPDAIMDMSVRPERRQWLREDRRFALNPVGRIQTKKHRPVIVVNDLLEEWLCATQDWFVCREKTAVNPETGEEVIIQTGVASIRSAWDTMRETLKLPQSWGPKLLRHSMATELRRRGVDPWELAGQLGHRVLKTSELYAAYDPNYLSTVQAGIGDIVEDLRKLTGAVGVP